VPLEYKHSYPQVIGLFDGLTAGVQAFVQDAVQRSGYATAPRRATGCLRAVGVGWRVGANLV
jgi:hypothetical protein